MRWFQDVILFTVLSSVFLDIALALECYVCDNQDGNTDKCLKTIKTCEHSQDRCLTTIRWSTTPYWSEGAEKQYYVSKSCSTADECYKEIHGNMPLCHYIWYEDWKCAECCQGDRCNYYITLAASSASWSRVLMALSLFVSAISGCYALS